MAKISSADDAVRKKDTKNNCSLLGTVSLRFFEVFVKKVSFLNGHGNEPLLFF
jgi:hypothetical protein